MQSAETTMRQDVPPAAATQSPQRMYVTFLLDETGSMANIAGPTISGLNEYLDTLRSDPNADEIRFTLITFNTARTRTIYRGEPLDNVKPFPQEDYDPQAMTPLYDACVRAIHDTQEAVGDSRARVVVVFQTDGMENRSKVYDFATLKRLINQHRLQGWEFVFLGADFDAYPLAHDLGIQKSHVVNYGRTVVHTRETFSNLAANTRAYGASGMSMDMGFSEQQKKAAGDPGKPKADSAQRDLGGNA